MKYLSEAETRDRMANLDVLLREGLLLHGRQYDYDSCPSLRQQRGGSDTLAGMSRAHREIQR